jgi:DNA-binding transcriptional regulator YhcF (GntR family)
MNKLHKKLSCVYDRFEEEIEKQILNGELKAGDRVISENYAGMRSGLGIANTHSYPF